jgi:hypothetical protein
MIFEILELLLPIVAKKLSKFIIRNEFSYPA